MGLDRKGKAAGAWLNHCREATAFPATLSKEVLHREVLTAGIENCFSFPYFIVFLLIFRDEGEGNTNLLFRLSMHSLVDACMCPDRDQTQALV